MEKNMATKIRRTKPDDLGFMYGHGFQDLDSHIWELVYTEPTAIK